MRIRHFGGIETASTHDELRSILSKRFENESNEFWMFADNKEFPCMAILVKGNLANVSFICDENDIGYQSLGQAVGSKTGTFTVFYTNTPEEEIEIHDEMIVSAENAVKAAEEFFREHKMPCCIKWVKN